MTRGDVSLGVALLATLCLLLPSGVQARPGVAAIELVDRPVVDQGGKRLSFARDVVGSRRVVIATMYTTCATLCPLTSTVMQALQDELDRPGLEDVVLVSVTLDPGRDGVRALAEMADQYGAGPRWRFIGGNLLDVLLILDGFGVSPGPLEDHPPLFLVGRGGADEFVRLEGLPAPATIKELLAGFAP